MFCTACRQMTNWKPQDEVPGDSARCNHCKARRQLVPMRFVMVCRDGHIADVPWHRWAHSRGETPDQKQCQRGALYFKVRPGAGGGLASLVVECGIAECRASRTLAGLTDPAAMKHLGVRCRGLQPWQYPKAETEHDAVPEVLQRGASNVHFARVESALDIPPESNYSEYGEAVLAITSHKMWPVLVASPDAPFIDYILSAIAADAGVAEEAVRAHLRKVTGEQPVVVGQVDESDDLLGREFLAFVTPQDEADRRSTFVTRRVDLSSIGLGDRQVAVIESLDRMFDHIVIATKLREVRALTGFSRIDPAGTLVRPDLGRGLDWLPALEVFGEGVFVALREDLVQEWESGPVERHVESMVNRRAASRMAFWLPEATPRFVLVHTFAHLLIRQLAFDSGYSSASLRERIYATTPSSGNPGQAGVLIYTAAGDAEGTLGGLARLGEPERLAPSLLAMFQRALWCSNDPICRDSPGQGVGALNKAACHACALISETSCVHSNALLDRSAVVGAESLGVSFFESELRLAMGRMAATGV